MDCQDCLVTQLGLIALLDRIEAETVGQRLTVLECSRIKIDAPLGIALLCLCQLVSLVEDRYLILAVSIGVQ